MASIVLNEDQHNRFDEGDVATMRVYITADTKRAVVVKEDDLLSKKDFAAHVSEVTTALISEQLLLQDLPSQGCQECDDIQICGKMEEDQGQGRQDHPCNQNAPYGR